MMERDKELIKLINVLRRTSRMALQSEWTGGSQDAASYCTDQYNRVLARLKELDASVGTVFDQLPAGSSLTVVAMASRQLTAYYEDEVGGSKAFRGFTSIRRLSRAQSRSRNSGKRERESSKIWASSFAKASKSGRASAKARMKAEG
jgi:hypothetical protein